MSPRARAVLLGAARGSALSAGFVVLWMEVASPLGYSPRLLQAAAFVGAFAGGIRAGWVGRSLFGTVVAWMSVAMAADVVAAAPHAFGAESDLIRREPLQLYVPLLLTAGFVGVAELAIEAVLALAHVARRGAIVGGVEGLAVGALLLLVTTVVNPGRVGGIEIGRRLMGDLTVVLSCGLCLLGGATAALAVYTRRPGGNHGLARSVMLTVVLWGVLPLAVLADLHPNENFLLRTEPCEPLPTALGAAGLGGLYLVAWTLARPRTLPAVDRMDPALRPPHLAALPARGVGLAVVADPCLAAGPRGTTPSRYRVATPSDHHPPSPGYPRCIFARLSLSLV